MKLRYLLLPILFSTVSCTYLNNIAPGYSKAIEAITVFYTGYENTITKEVIDSIPYSSALLRIGKGPFGLIILESKNDNIETWVSADNVYFKLKDGKIIGTAGLVNNLTSYLRNDFQLFDHGSKEEKLFTSYYSYDEPVLTNLEVKSTLFYKGIEEVDLLMGKKKLFLFHENLFNNYLNWNVTNKFWVDEDGFVWKSRQHISTKLPPIEIEVTKKPAI
tara:strand:- start:502 stop:1155 length:654 start_codon:yes stop_codon:yes gene_type:complete